MSAIFEVITSIISPLVLVGLAGLFFIPHDDEVGLVGKSARVVIGGLSVLLLLSYVAALFRLSLMVVLLPLGISVLWFLWRHWPHIQAHRTHWRAIIACSVFLVLFVAFAIPFLQIHRGLPTGDSQKAIIWAEKILATGALPNYAESVTWLNRDPVDFLTPGLHSLTALFLELSPLPLTTVGYLAILIALSIALVAAALLRTLWPRLPARLAFSLALVVVLSQERFLRYLREPGYHLQNSLGELFLMALIWLGLSLMTTWRWRDIILFTLAALSLLLSHQFSVFLSGFVLIPGIYVALARIMTGQTIAPFWLRWVGGLAALGVATAGWFAFDVPQKLPALFTTTPHLLPLTPSLSDYPVLMGGVWLSLGLSGLFLLWWRFRWLTVPQRVFVVSASILLLLSQGPRFGIDIPPVRALFYTVVPLSVSGVYLLLQLVQAVQKLAPTWRRLGMGFLSLLILFTSYTSVTDAYIISHQVRTNSTLRPEHLALSAFLASSPETGAVVADDYNQRASSWLVLGTRPMYTRLASALGRQMEEAKQSELRYQLYLNQLAYEKMYSLGSLSATAAYAEEQGVSWLTGIAGRSGIAFAANPALATASSVGETTLYQVGESSTANTCQPLEHSAWLYRASTLANDIGDPEDTFQALPASLAANRLSDWNTLPKCTTRQTRATRIPLRFNVGDYVTVLWDQDKNSRIDRDLSLLVQWARNPEQTLIVATPTGSTYELPANDLLTLPVSDMPIDDEGFVTVWIQNPEGLELSFDVIALGLSQTL